MGEFLKNIPFLGLLSDFRPSNKSNSNHKPGCISRREFLRMAALVGASVGAGRLLTACDGTSHPIRLESAVPIAHGIPINTNGQMAVFFEDDFDNKIEATIPLSSTNPVYSIYGVVDCMYLVNTNLKRVYIPFDQLEIIDGDPFKYVVANPKLGIRNNSKDMMKYVRLIGSKVRIAGPTEAIATNSELDETIRKAQEYGLNILFVFNTNRLLTAEEGGDDEIRRRVRNLVLNYGVELQIGNEMDNEIVNFWENQDLATFAHFASVVINEARLHRPKIRIVLGALLKLEKTRELIDYLKKEGVDVNKVEFALHTYDSVEDVRLRVETFKSIVGRPPDVISEMGIRDRDKSQLPAMAKEAFKLGVKEIIFHELPDFEGNGLINPDGTPPKPSSDFCLLAHWSAQNRN